jgi:hypothetical protein
MAIIDKRRPKANVSEVMHVIGDIEGRNCVIMDDMIDTAGTLVKAAEVLKERGAKKVYAYCTHPVFSGPAIERLSKGDALDEVVITNTIHEVAKSGISFGIPNPFEVEMAETASLAAANPIMGMIVMIVMIVMTVMNNPHHRIMLLEGALRVDLVRAEHQNPLKVSLLLAALVTHLHL